MDSTDSMNWLEGGDTEMAIEEDYVEITEP